MKETNVNDQEPIKWGGLLNEFLWICAGVNRKLVRQCPTDYAKYAGQGGLILFTGLMAMLSGGYAFSTIFDNTALAVAFGIFWGLLIFNLDRFIVNTMYSDGKHTISWFELMAGFPRIIIAIFLGIVISTPLELKIFDDRINWQIERDNENRTASTLNEDKVTLTRHKTDNDELQSLLTQRRLLTDNLNRASNDLADEEAGLALSGKAGQGPVWRAKSQRKNDCKDALDDWDRLNMDRVRYLQQSTQAAASTIKQKTENLQTLGENRGFCVRYEAFSNIKKENQSVRLVSIFIMLMFIIIEIAPTFFKMMVASGPYDDLLRIESEKKKVYADEVIGKLRNELNTALTISTKTNKEKEDIELQNNKELLTKIANIQSEVLEVAIQKWREEELEKANKNPGTFISKS